MILLPRFHPTASLLCLVAVLSTSASPADTATVKEHNGRPALFINGRPVPPFAYMSYLGKEPYYREVAKAGIHLYCFPAYLGDRGINPRSGIGPFRPSIWKGENTYDFFSVEKDFETLLKADPLAHVIVRLHLDPPQWWESDHPDGCCRLPDGTTFRQCFASPVWREATAEALRAFLAWVQQSSYAKHLIGVHVAAGGTEEWFYHYRGVFHDLNPARAAEFRAWLRSAYRDDAGRFRAAWRDQDVDFDSAALADISAGSAKTWRNPKDSQPIVDTFRFHSQTIVNDIAQFCRIVKQESNGRLLTGAFYGYHYFVNDPRSGHFALSKLLECPDLDYLSSPNAYHRVMGEDWPPMVALASVARHGKLWLAENDTRTFKTTLLKDQAPEICPPGYYDGGVWFGPATAEESVAMLRKNTARMLAGGYGGWWFDMWGGWFSEPRLMAVLQRTQELGEQALHRAVPAMAPQVCVVTDEELSYLDATFGALTAAIMQNRYALGRSGTPYDLYLRSDLPGIERPPYRAVWLLGPFELTTEEEDILEKWRSAGATILWTRPSLTTLQRPDGSRESFEGKIAWLPAELRDLWKSSGAHVYLDSDDVLYAGRGWVSVHTVTGGKRIIQLPFAARIEDAFEPKVLSESTQSLNLDLPPNSTMLLHITPCE
jgi:beta-galactosidase